MPEVDPAYYDAIDDVVEQRKGDADWEPDEMRSALMDVAQGDSQSEAASERSFSQPLLSQRWADVEDRAEQIRQKRTGGSALFRDPVEEAVESFQEFFEELDEKYDLSVSSRVVQMMADEIRDAEQLPLPMYLEKFLRGTNSGVQGTDVDYIRRRYESWVSNHEDDFGGSQMPNGQMGGMGGRSVGGNQQNGMNMGQGVPVGGGGMGQQQGGRQPQYGQQHPPQQHPNHPPQQGGGDGEPAEDPRVDELQEQVEALNTAIGELMQEEQNNEQTVVVETDDGIKAEMPMQQAVQMGYLGDDEPDFMEKLQKAQQAGVIPSPDDGDDDDGRDLMETIELLKEMGVVDDGSGDDMADAIGDAIESLGERQVQAQQQMSQNMQQVMEEMRQMQETDEEDLTAQDVQDIVESTLTKSETEQIREEMDEKFSKVMEQVEESNRREITGKHDPEFLKTDRKMQYQEKQLETLNENLREIPEAMAVSIRDGLVPAIKEMQMSRGNQMQELWQPPQSGNRGEPEYEPNPNPDPTDRRPREQQRYSEPPRAEQTEPDTSDIEENAEDLRENLGLNGGGSEEGDEQ